MIDLDSLFLAMFKAGFYGFFLFLFISIVTRMFIMNWDRVVKQKEPKTK